MKSPYDLIIRPVLTESSYEGIGNKRYVFEVAPDANKTEIRQAVEAVFGVKVQNVNTLRRIGKVKRQGQHSGRRPERKLAFVQLTKESKAIEFFEGMA